MATRWWHSPDGEIEVGDRDAVAELLGITVKTWARYRERTWRDEPPPRPVTINPDTRRDEWSLDEIRAWHSRRRGPGRRRD